MTVINSPSFFYIDTHSMAVGGYIYTQQLSTNGPLTHSQEYSHGYTL